MKKNLLKKLFLILIVFTIFTLNAKALDYIKKTDSVCTLTDAYKAWEKLSEKQKKNTMVPVKCKETIESASKLSKLSNLSKGVNLSSYLNASKFNLMDVNGNSYITPIKSQVYSSNTDSNMCWAFAANAVVESAYLLEGGTAIDLSEKHISYSASRTLEDGTTNPFGYYGHSNTNGVDSGGSMLMSGTYLAQRRGPVLESKLPFTSTSSTKANTIDLKPDYYVEDISYYMASESCGSQNIINDMKSLIVNYGALDSYMNVDIAHYLSTDKSSFYYNGPLTPSHSITIIGWDDDYPKENFSTTDSGIPAGNGAWIVKNTYPTLMTSDLGDGYHYTSYYDSDVCNAILYVKGVKAGNDFTLYTHDKLGASDGFIASSNNTIFYKQIYDKKSSGNERLESVNIFGQLNDSYELYYSTVDNFAQAVKIAEGNFNSTGYKTVSINKKIISTSKFYLYLKYVSSYEDSGMYYLPVYLNESGLYSLETITTGVSFYSRGDTSQWIDTTSNSENQFYPNIYAFTTSGNFSLQSSTPVNGGTSVTPTSGYYNISLTMSGITIDDISVNIFNDNSVDVTNKFTIEKYSNGFKVTPKVNMVNPGNYTVTFDAYDLSTQEHITIYPDPIMITSLTISGHDNVTLNSTLTLTAIVLPEEATNKTITWTSSDTSIATVSNGVVTGRSLGSVIISAATTDGSNLTATKNISVVSNEVKVTSIEINGSNQLNVAESTTLTATILPENATNKVVIWTSSDEAVATVNAQGVVTGISEGTVTITAITTDGSNKSATKTISVKSIKVLVNRIKVSGLDEASVNGTLNLSVDVSPSNATNKVVEWISGDTTIATVTENGVVTGKKAGRVTISAKTTDGSNLTDSKIITIVDINKEEGQGVTTPTSDVNNPKTGDFKDILLIMLIVTGIFGFIYMKKKGIIRSI